MIDASVVICAYTIDRWDDLNAAVASVRRQVRPAHEILVVVDNNEVLLERAKHEFDGVTAIPNTKARGLCGARMTGAELATAPVIAFLDDDAIADTHWLQELLIPYKDDFVLGVGGHIEPLWRNPCPRWFPPEFNWVVGCTYRGMQIRDGRVRNMIGANMSVRADVLRGCGGFADPRLGRTGSANGSCEDTEFCIRAARLYGGVWVHQPNASVRHVVTAERATWKYFLHRCRMEGSSKAVVTDLAGARDGLKSERRYVRTLAQSIIGYVAARDLGQAFAICIGLAVTTAAYGRARLARARLRSMTGQYTAPFDTT